MDSLIGCLPPSFVFLLPAEKGYLSNKGVCFVFLSFSKKKVPQKSKTLQSQMSFEQTLHISLDLTPEEVEELRKLKARYR